MYDQYFQDMDVRPEFKKEFISLWNGWLGKENLHKLDLVEESEWNRFNDLLALICARYEVLIADPANCSCKVVAHASELVQNYDEAMAKDTSQFTRLVVPELNCALTESWDFTFILWHLDGVAVETLAPLIEQAKLHHFAQDAT